jgi:hypothetical protein
VTVVPFPTDRIVNEPLLTKRQIAAHFNYSVRWIELRMLEGMPSVKLGGRRRFRLSEVAAWFNEREAK